MVQKDDKDIALAVKAFKIGNKVRDLRQKNRFTLQDLAERTGLSKPFLSQIENNHVIPPVTTLLRLARGLSVNMAHFFDVNRLEDKISITRHNEGVRIERRPHQDKQEANYVYTALELRKSTKHMDPYLVDFPMHDSSDMLFTSHEGEEFIYILEGEVEFRTVDRVEVLEAGDCIYIDSDLSHSFRCLKDIPSKGLAILCTTKTG